MIKLIIEEDGRRISEFTMVDSVAKALLSGKDIVARFGGYDPEGPYCTKASVRAEPVDWL
jgi:hypothetical protein